MNFPVITIDGPSGAGKGTIARRVAQGMGFHLLDSGALYRLTALACLQAECDLEDEAAVASLARNLTVSFEVTDAGHDVLLDQQIVTQTIREERVGLTASKVAAYPAVRSALLQRQRDFAQSPGLVCDGRDMGTTVFPQAPVKFFVTASAEERAHRRMRQLAELGTTGEYEQILADIVRRDEADRSRASSPLVPADDAVHVDTDGLSIEQVCERVAEVIHQRLNLTF